MNIAELAQPAEQKAFGNFPQPHADLRDWLERVEGIGELLRVSGVNWKLEMGAVAEMVYHARPENPPAILFENIPDYSPEFRVLSGMTNSPQRLALTLGLPLSKRPLDVVRAYRDRMKNFALIPNEFVESGPLLENVDRDEAVDLFKFPVPFLHELDGGRYIGTADLIIMKDPDTGWVNVGTYRAQVHDKNTIGIWMSPGKHGRLIREKYFKMGKPCPVVISCGHDPLLFLSSGNEVNYQVAEFAHAGGHRGIPFETLKSELHGLPMPARAEIVLEGEILLDDLRLEGPFGEWTGYYASSTRPDNVVRVKRVYHRNSPIITMACPMRPPSDYTLSKSVIKSAMIWDQVERAGLSGVEGVWCHESGGGRLFNVISIKQAYAGHARQAAMLAANVHAGNYLGRFVVVVDHDIDPSNPFDVMWAMSTRCDPSEDIEFIRQAWSGPLDPRKRKGISHNSRAVVIATRPFEWMSEFPPVAESSPELRAQTLERWGHILEQPATVRS
ncbi:UbiD family decarboxylase [Tunturiibacter gelidoferens]|uniref:UbiD family decarboxylase n=1 Tax=Tunturiibacter gelidiferens TaxID=3069689 RepID=A0AAU7Z0I3_9BACT